MIRDAMRRLQALAGLTLLAGAIPSENTPADAGDPQRQRRRKTRIGSWTPKARHNETRAHRREIAKASRRANRRK